MFKERSSLSTTGLKYFVNPCKRIGSPSTCNPDAFKYIGFRKGNKWYAFPLAASFLYICFDESRTKKQRDHPNKRLLSYYRLGEELTWESNFRQRLSGLEGSNRGSIQVETGDCSCPDSCRPVIEVKGSTKLDCPLR